MKRATIDDVSKKAGVSKSTVSHVINNTRFVSEETVQRVQEAIAELGYRPSIAARSLTTNKTKLIGVIVSDAANTFFGEILRGIEDILQPKDYSIMICNTDEILERENYYIDMLLRQRVDGIIAAATSKKWGILDQANKQNTPIIFLDRTFEGLDHPFVGVNNIEGARLGANHLIECGHEKIGILAGFQRLSTMQERLKGFQMALHDHGINLPDEWIIESLLGIEYGRESALKILTLNERPTALFINNNLLSLGALAAIKELGIRCPEEISIMGFDDHPWAAVSCPPLTVIRQPSRRLGQVAAEMMFSIINEDPLTEERVILECELVVRESCSSSINGKIAIPPGS